MAIRPFFRRLCLLDGNPCTPPGIFLKNTKNCLIKKFSSYDDLSIMTASVLNSVDDNLSEFETKFVQQDKLRRQIDKTIDNDNLLSPESTRDSLSIPRRDF